MRKFDKGGSGHRGGSFGNRGGGFRGGGGFGDRKMHKATCSECGQECEVPFKPTSDKPIYCSDCFKKEPGSKSGNSGKDFAEINKKLDKIMKALDIE